MGGIDNGGTALPMVAVVAVVVVAEEDGKEGKRRESPIFDPL